MTEEQACFVIAPIGEAESETRKRSDQVLKHVIKPAVSTCGYKAIRADEIDKPGIITSQVIQRIVNDPLVVADLTERNPNVFYELAIRHALRKPLVQLIRKGDAMPFDVAGTRTIQVDHHDLDSVEAAKQEIVEQIKAIEKDNTDIETPISVSLDLQLLRQSERPEERSLADLVSAVSDLRTGIIKLESRIGTRDQPSHLEQLRTENDTLRARLEGLLVREIHIPARREHEDRLMIQEIIRLSGKVSPNLGILMFSSLFRDEMPWIYELGVELHRLARGGTGPALDKAISDYQFSVGMAFHSPFRDILVRGKEGVLEFAEIEKRLDEILKSFSSAAVRRPGER